MPRSAPPPPGAVCGRVRFRREQVVDLPFPAAQSELATDLHAAASTTRAPKSDAASPRALPRERAPSETPPRRRSGSYADRRREGWSVPTPSGRRPPARPRVQRPWVGTAPRRRRGEASCSLGRHVEPLSRARSRAPRDVEPRGEERQRAPSVSDHRPQPGITAQHPREDEPGDARSSSRRGSRARAAAVPVALEQLERGRIGMHRERRTRARSAPGGREPLVVEREATDPAAADQAVQGRIDETSRATLDGALDVARGQHAEPDGPSPVSCSSAELRVEAACPVDAGGPVERIEPRVAERDDGAVDADPVDGGELCSDSPEGLVQEPASPGCASSSRKMTKYSPPSCSATRGDVGASLQQLEVRAGVQM